MPNPYRSPVHGFDRVDNTPNPSNCSQSAASMACLSTRFQDDVDAPVDRRLNRYRSLVSVDKLRGCLKSSDRHQSRAVPLLAGVCAGAASRPAAAFVVITWLPSADWRNHSIQSRQISTISVEDEPSASFYHGSQDE